MTIKYMIEGSNVSIFKMNEETALDYLPAGVYTVQFSQVAGFYLSITKKRLDTPARIYGDVEERAERCITTYVDRDTSTGVLLTGDKGTGKSLLLSILANTVIDTLNMPVILIKESFAGTQFTDFIETLGECCLVFDEFGKLYASYNRDDDTISQHALLSLMDGVDKTKRLIILSENREADINEFILNRPSRVYYHFRYNKLDEASIKDYCDDNDLDTAFKRDLLDVSRRSKSFSFDMLQSIVEEHLRFNSSVEECVKFLNIDVRESTTPRMEVLEVIEKATGQQRQLLDSAIVEKPMRYDYTYIRLKPTGKATNTRRKSEIEQPVEVNSKQTTSNDNEYDEITLEATYLVFEKNGKEIYDIGQYTVITKIIEQEYINYSLFI